MPDILFVFAFILIVILLGLGLVRGPYQPERDARMPKFTELPQSLLLLLVTLIWSRNADARYLVIVAGIGFGFAGDLFMANVFRMKSNVIWGMLSFALGHVCYLIAFAMLARSLKLEMVGAYAASIGLCWGFAAIIWAVLIRTPGGGALQYAALVYGLFLATVAGAAIALAVQSTAFVGLALGAILFMISDMLLGAQIFANRHFRYMGDVVWGTYIFAQILIIFTLTAAASLSPA